MHRDTTHTARRSRSLVVCLLALAIVAVFGIAASQALAIGEYSHDGATVCSSCHDGAPSKATATNAKCITCHTSFAVPTATKTCWTCHQPGQDMSAVAGGAPTTCTTVCHKLPGGAAVPNSGHNPHPDRGVCTTCHQMSTGVTAPNGSPHHTAKVVPATTITLKITPTSIKLRKSVKATGAVTPMLVLVGVKVGLKAEMKKGTKWVNAKTGTATASAAGLYTWTYKPTKKGSYRVTATILPSAAYLGSKATKPFKVK
jgi:hypothetical protein